MSFTYQTQQANLDWNAEDLPHSRDYGDVYYSRADAIGESSHVFHSGNQLEQRFQALADAPSGASFVIGELGFGAGLNFLNTCKLWCETAPSSARLHYLACELHPFSAADLARLHAHFSGFAELSAQLLSLYPAHTSGVHQIDLHAGNHRISLTLLLTDAVDLLQTTGASPAMKVDAWFLDGFSPKTNPAMWQTALLQQLAVLSHDDTTLASYSVAGVFRRNLEAAGFSWEKLPGFAEKRHMLRARLSAECSARQRHKSKAAGQTVCVIGAGLAGCSTAHALATSGWKVLLIDRESGVAAQASGNPQGVLHLKPGTVDSADNRFNLHSYLFASRHYRSLGLPATTWSHCGMLQLAHDHKLLKRFGTLADQGMYSTEIVQVLTQEEASALCGIRLERPALFFPDAGWVAPRALCAWYSSHPSITMHYNHEVITVEQDQGGWEILLRSEKGESWLHSDRVIVCNSADVHTFAQTRHLPVISNRGQVDVYPSTKAITIDKVICGQGYIIPGSEGVQTIGGSFFIESDSTELAEKYRRWHLDQLAGINPELAATLARQQPLLQRTAARCTLPDRMPVAGAVDTERYPGLWVNVGHGSQGLARTPICAALLASCLNHTPAPVAVDVARVISPGRYRVQA
jgi:tRNA 5-methylaminomethyl-2-thiouridine biosynthesis bifunctional protein